MNDNVLVVEQDRKEWILEKLRDPNENVTVVFTKKDGSERVLKCTLSESQIPADKHPKTNEGGAVAKKSDEAQAVFDTEIGEWRSFRWDSIKNVEVA